jgi:pyrophosphatase PpaX
MPRIDTILFDFDGTLADSIDLIVTTFRQATEEVLGAPLPDKIVLDNLGRPLSEYFEQLAPSGKADELIRAYRRHNLENHDALIREYPHVRETVAELAARGYRLGIVTSKGRELTGKGLAAVGLKELFSVVVTLEDTEHHKPSPEPIEFALEKLNAKRRRAAYVGDSPWDIVSGKAAGVMTVAVLWGGFSEADLAASGPDLIVRDPRRLLELFPAPSEEGAPGPRGRHRAGREGRE